MVAQHNKLVDASGFTIFGLFNAPSFVKKEKEAIEISKYWLDIIGLTHRADDDAGDLPYGDQRKLEIVRRQRNEETVLLWLYNNKPDGILLQDRYAKPWIRDYTLASCKVMLGEARSKFATIAGTLYGLDKSFKPFSYMQLLLPIFASAIVGGVGNPLGAIAGGYTIAFSEIIVTFAYKKVVKYLGLFEPDSLVQFLSTDYKIAVSFFLLVVVLIVKPSGIFSGKTL